jgi:hypothetical protein
MPYESATERWKSRWAGATSRTSFGTQYNQAVEARKHQLSVQCPTDPMEVGADGDRLTQVLATLLSNAAKYSPDSSHVTSALATMLSRRNSIGQSPTCRCRWPRASPRPSWSMRQKHAPRPTAGFNQMLLENVKEVFIVLSYVGGMGRCLGAIRMSGHRPARLRRRP